MKYFMILTIVLLIQQRPVEIEIKEWSAKHPDWAKIDYYTGKDFIESMYFCLPSSIKKRSDSHTEIQIMEAPYTFIIDNVNRFIRDSQAKYNFNIKPRFCVYKYVVNCNEQLLCIDRIDFYDEQNNLLITVHNPTTDQIWSKVLIDFGIGEKILDLFCQ